MQHEATPPQFTVQVADIVAATGAQTKTVYRWTDSGALRAEQETTGLGSGRHRRYAISELFVAAVLQEIIGFASVGTTVEIANAIRAQLFEAPEGGWRKEEPFLSGWNRVLTESPAALLLCKRGDDLDVGVMLGNLGDPKRKLLGVKTLKGYHPIVVIDLNETWRPVCDFLAGRP